MSWGRELDEMEIFFFSFSFLFFILLSLLKILVFAVTHGRDQIRVSENSAWAFSWWAYIWGGDYRYARPDSALIAMETLSVCNGVVLFISLWKSSLGRNLTLPVLLAFTSSATVHFYSCSLYYLSEFYSGFASVGSTFTEFWVKFVFANSPWIFGPPFVITWCLYEISQLVKSPKSKAN